VINPTRKYWSLLLCLFAVSCAQVRSLPGGEKDTKPPLALMAFPPHLTTNFQEKSIVIVFDEYVQLNNINQELIISPPLQKKPEIIIKQKSLVVKFKEELLPNTTYQLNFGDGIADVNENNKVESLIYVFSTGDHVDSLSVRGFVHDVEKDIPAEGLKVMLFDDDTMVFSKKSTPLYFTKTKKDGSFSLDYLKEGEFYIFAVDDQNSNYRRDDEETIAFTKQLIRVSNVDSTFLTLQASNPISETPKTDDYKTDSIGSLRFYAHPHYGAFNVRSAANLDVKQFSSNDTVIAFIDGKPTNRFEELVVEWNNLFFDTLEIPFFDEATNASFKLRCDAGKKIRISDSPKIVSSQPFQIKDISKISLVSDSVEVPFKIIDNNLPFEKTLETSLKQGKSYSLKILPGAVTNASGASNDSLICSVSTYKTEDLGTILFELDTEKNIEDLILIITDKNNQVIFTENNINAKNIAVKDLPPGEYFGKLIEDTNQNGLYDAAILSEKKEPEITHVYTGKINVRSNWELKVKWAF